MSKKYGLIVPGKKNDHPVQPTANFTKPSIFGSDSDSDDGLPPMRKAATIGPGFNERRQARKIQEKALQEDPTIFQYDELYDEIESKRDQQKTEKGKEEKKPKYIGRLLECAERRKIENERRLERMIQKERELEGEQFKDKESFVTSAYRKKLEELRKAEERDKREEYLEAIGDVTKQQNLDGFYRHLYEQKLGPKEIEQKSDTSKEESKEEIQPSHEDKSSSNKFNKNVKPRVYRKRKTSNDNDQESSEEEISTKKVHLQSNIDADSDFSIDSSSSEDEDDKEAKSTGGPEDKVIIKKEPEDKENTDAIFKRPENVGPRKDTPKAESKAETIKKEPKDGDDSKAEETVTKEHPPKTVKKDIWKKRTVGEVLEAALQRFYERKAAKNA